MIPSFVAPDLRGATEIFQRRFGCLDAGVVHLAPVETHGKTMEKHGKTMETHGKPMGNPWENMGKPWEPHGKPMEKNRKTWLMMCKT